MTKRGEVGEGRKGGERREDGRKTDGGREEVREEARAEVREEERAEVREEARATQSSCVLIKKSLLKPRCSKSWMVAAKSAARISMRASSLSSPPCHMSHAPARGSAWPSESHHVSHIMCHRPRHLPCHLPQRSTVASPSRGRFTRSRARESWPTDRLRLPTWLPTWLPTCRLQTLYASARGFVWGHDATQRGEAEHATRPPERAKRHARRAPRGQLACLGDSDATARVTLARKPPWLKAAACSCVAQRPSTTASSPADAIKQPPRIFAC